MPEIDARALAAGAAKTGPLATGETLRLNRQRTATWQPAEIGLDEHAHHAGDVASEPVRDGACEREQRDDTDERQQQ